MKRGTFAVFLVLVALQTVACTASGTEELAADPTPTPAPTAEPSPTDPPPTASAPILPTPAAVTALEDRLLASLEIQVEPDELALLNGFIWTKTADGHVVQIDPATNAVIADVKVDTTSDMYHYCGGLGTDGEHVWSCSASGDADNRLIDVVRLDPATQEVVQTYAVDKIFDQWELPFLDGRIWVLTGDGDKLVGIDVATNEPGPAIDLGVRCLQLSAARGSLFATCRNENVILQIDPGSGQITRRIEVEGPEFVAADDSSLWVVSLNSVLRLDAETLEPIAQWGPLGFVSDFQVTGDAVWLRQRDGFLYRIDPATNTLVEQIVPSERLAAGHVLVTEDSIWTTAYDDSLLLRLSLEE